MDRDAIEKKLDLQRTQEIDIEGLGLNLDELQMIQELEVFLPDPPKIIKDPEVKIKKKADDRYRPLNK